MTHDAFDRRAFLQTVAVAGAAVLAGCGGDGDADTPAEATTPAETEPPDDGSGGDVTYVDQEPDYAGYLEDANGYEGTVDFRDANEVTVMVGGVDGFAFEPAAIAISAGATVTWEWTGQGGQHNVASDDLGFESELIQEEGHTFTHTFEETGTHTYYCDPHESLGMKGGVHVE